MSRSRVAAFAAPLLVVGSIAGAATPAFAAKGGRNVTAQAGACATNPGTVPAYTTYTLSGTGLPASTIVDVWTSDAGGVHWVSAMTDAGAMAFDASSAYAGTSTVSITSGARQATQLASCSFQVL